VNDFHDLAGSLRLTRRRALAWAGGLGLAAVIPGCGGGRSSTPSSSTPTSVTGASTAASSADCVLMPELTEGPYYLDLDLVRKDITGGKPGLPLGLRVNVVKVGNACSPIKDSAIDVWHADAGGEYSGVQGVAGNFLRGIQMTDATGKADFETIYPGWYTGRAVHIHVKVHVGASEVHTGQLFFDEDVTDAVYKTDPYSRRPDRDTLNSSDSIFSQSQGVTIVAVTPGTDHSSGAVTLGVQ
jgi:protocatechuate 3,4-dioxygenase beta subunit